MSLEGEEGVEEDWWPQGHTPSSSDKERGKGHHAAEPILSLFIHARALSLSLPLPLLFPLPLPLPLPLPQPWHLHYPGIFTTAASTSSSTASAGLSSGTLTLLHGARPWLLSIALQSAGIHAA